MKCKCATVGPCIYNRIKKCIILRVMSERDQQTKQSVKKKKKTQTPQLNFKNQRGRVSHGGKSIKSELKRNLLLFLFIADSE